MLYWNCLLTRSRSYEFWNWPCLSNQAVFSTWPKSHDKNLNILRTKRAFKIKYKAFFITFKGLSVNPIMQSFFFGSWEPDFKEEICKNTFFIESLQWLFLPKRLSTTKIAFTITIQMTIQHFLAQRSKYSTKLTA